MTTVHDRFIQAFGDASNRSGVISEMAGKIYAALYLSPGALSLDEICGQVGASKGNVSVQVRELLALGMVRKASVRSSRRHYYEAVTDLWAIATEVIGRRLEQEAQTLLHALQSLEPELASGPGAGDLVKTRLATMRIFLQTATALIGGFRRGEALEPEALRKTGS